MERAGRTLREIERRRTQSLVVILVVMTALAFIITLQSFAGDLIGEVAYLRTSGFRLAPLVLVGALSLYLVDQHRTFIAVTRKAFEDGEALERVTHQLRHDGLTGLLTRDSFVDALDVRLADARPTGVLFIDLDNFKRINDTWGHNAGDRFLVEVADRLARACGVANTGRYAGDEFVVQVDCAEGDATADIVAARVLDVLSQPMDFDGTTVVPSAAVGIATSRPDVVGASALLREADMAMYVAKQRGKAQAARLSGHGELLERAADR